MWNNTSGEQRNETDKDRDAHTAQYQEENARLASTGTKDARKMRVSDLAVGWNRR